MPTWLRARLARRDDEGLSGPAGVPQAQDAVGFAEASPAWPMAHFVKWCRARFFNGYRPFSVLQADGQDGRSDTEALLRGGHPPPSPCPPPAAPSPGPPGRADSRDRERTPSQERAARRERLPSPERERERDKEEKKTHLNFEEFECDVSVEGGVDEAGQERQEFSFTLYDFDGHGKITKDDITGLVSTIYETLGASIKVPHYGSKTIKVKLTVSPDKRAAQGGARGAKAGQATYVNASASPAAEPQSTPPRVRFKRDLNVTIQERRPPRPRRASSASARRRPAAPPAPRRERESERDPSEDRGYVVHSCSSSCRSGGGSEGGDAEMDGSADEDMGDMEDDEDDDGVRRPTGLSPASVAAAAATAATMASAAQAAANGCQSPHVKKRSSSLQRQELLQIIQANMEKMAKKSCGERTGLEERRHSHSGVHPHRHRQRQKATLSASASPQRIYDYATTPYYVNLVEKGESAATGDADTYRYVVCSSKHQPTYLNVPCRERGHNRSRSHDLTTNTHNHAHAHQLTHNPAAPLFRYTLLQEDNTSSVQAFNVKPARSPAANRRVRLPPAAVGHTSSPHHLKHRNREQDQARAMAQVVQWLEQEFSASLNTRTTAGVQEVLINAKTHRMKSKSTAFTSAPETPSANSVPNASGNTPRPPQTDEDPAPQAAGVKQHEHRHVHEHIHHHYHHYQDAAPVLV